ncbi:hypothetical protein EV426DRAFT_711875 [Tirmania nivea]|nr:hypothetical protein EV426DRAFT_711875 [Tirmania nivea]
MPHQNVQFCNSRTTGRDLTLPANSHVPATDVPTAAIDNSPSTSAAPPTTGLCDEDLTQIITDKSPSSGVVPLTTGLQDEYLVQLTINKSPSSSVAAPPAATPSDSLQSNEDTSDSMIVPPTYEPNPAIGLFDTPATATSTTAPAATPSDSL